MRLVRSRVSVKDFDTERWNAVADHLRANKGGLGDLGGGNHFLDALGRPKLSKYLRSLPKLPENYRVLDCFVLRKQERLAQND
jgi:hypothetical protein